LGKKDHPMKLFGTVQSFDKDGGFGAIKPDTGGGDLRFENSAINWDRGGHPKADQRLSYELGTGTTGEPCAINLRQAI
jgi:cold shock CspA family protein